MQSNYNQEDIYLPALQNSISREIAHFAIHTGISLSILLSSSLFLLFQVLLMILLGANRDIKPENKVADIVCGAIVEHGRPFSNMKKITFQYFFIENV